MDRRSRPRPASFVSSWRDAPKPLGAYPPKWGLRTVPLSALRA